MHSKYTVWLYLETYLYFLSKLHSKYNQKVWLEVVDDNLSTDPTLVNYMDTYDSNGNLVFDTNDNGIYSDSWGSDGLDNDNDWGPYKDNLGNAFDIPYEPFTDLNGNGVYDSDVAEGYADILGNMVLLDFGLDGIPADDINGDGDYDDEGEIGPD